MNSEHEIEACEEEIRALQESMRRLEETTKETRSLTVRLNAKSQSTSTFTSGIYRTGLQCQDQPGNSRLSLS